MEKNQFLDYQGLVVTVGELLKRIDNCGGTIPYPNLASFPTVGKENILYIDQESNELYRWDDENIKYYRVGTDYHNIEIITGGDSKS